MTHEPVLRTLPRHARALAAGPGADTGPVGGGMPRQHLVFGAMRLSQLLLPTERQPPADAEALSHKLMVRAGLVRQLGSGLWTWLPAGWRVHQRVVQIVRDEMDGIGGQEMLMPVLNPRELWRRTGRDAIDEVFKLKDRRGAEMVLAMTHEEAVTYHVAQVVRSYRDLPQILYHFQTKERDEPRPRAGVLRTREFIMKDAYSFDRDEEGLAASYEKHAQAYDRIFDRVGLEWYRVESDVGMMGGIGAHEYMAPCPAGENDVALAPGYAANVEVASAEAQPVELPASPNGRPEKVHTPGMTTIEAVAGHLGLPAGALLKAFPVVTEDRGMVMVVVRGDHRVNEIKLQNALGSGFRPARPEEIAETVGPPGFIGPVGIDLPVLLDHAVVPGAYVAGANEPDAHLRGVEPGRDFPYDAVDVRVVEAGDSVNGHVIHIEPAIEVGNIFKLGTRFSDPLGATYLDETGKEQTIWMGSYGIGPARIAAAAVEQNADEKGIAWPRAIAPWDVELVTLGRPGTPEREAADALYEELKAAGIDVLYDDRDAGPGEKFADAELLGCPLRLTLGKRSLQSGAIEAQVRRGLRDHEGGVPLAGAAEAVAQLWRSLP
ncbi:MAG: prolyl-tRNA synthetase [Solirubrobacteraceae bacterium]|nr:prolyl-tRNA synthetase [Solirubrobacteraceae bacterium]